MHNVFTYAYVICILAYIICRHAHDICIHAYKTGTAHEERCVQVALVVCGGFASCSVGSAERAGTGVPEKTMRSICTALCHSGSRGTGAAAWQTQESVHAQWYRIVAFDPPCPRLPLLSSFPDVHAGSGFVVLEFWRCGWLWVAGRTHVLWSRWAQSVSYVAPRFGDMSEHCVCKCGRRAFDFSQRSVVTKLAT